MKLVQFSLERFRNFVDKQTIDFSNNSVIIGPNNEGKTNVLKALAISWDLLMDFAKDKLPYSFSGNEIVFPAIDTSFSNDYYTKQTREHPNPFPIYVWGLDYPVSLKEDKNDKQKNVSTFILDIQLTDEEKEKIESNIKNLFKQSIVSLKLEFGPEIITLSVLQLDSASEIIIKETVRCIVKKISFLYIDPIRTVASISKMINNILDMMLRDVYMSRDYQNLDNMIFGLLDPTVKRLYNVLNKSLKQFIPAIHDNSFKFYHSNRPLHDLEIAIDDGNKTAIAQKGSGVQSLIAISLAQILSLNQPYGENIILAIEEPETHLHPKSIHEIKKVLSDIAKHNQLIITTHSPILANANDIKSNIIVSNNNIHHALRLKEIRETLGVYASDNLLFAENTILVEGIYDKMILEKILSSLSKKIAEALDNNSLVIYNCQGSSKVSAFVSLTQRFFYKSYIVLDNDKAGEDEKKKILKIDPSLSNKITSLPNPQKNESEIEDFIKPSSYADALIYLFGVGTKNQWIYHLTRSKKCWSETLKIILAKKQYPNPIKEFDMIQAKAIVANAVISNGLSAIKPQCQNVFKTLAMNIETMLDE
ncbi:MAG: AAA family ATPase [Lentisphaeria bacterium]|nr:AAA family ATPase [Lentisphaeria bacterium]